MQPIGSLLGCVRSTSDVHITPDHQEQKKQADLFKAACVKECPSFEISDINRSIMNEIYLYAVGRSTKLDSSKGLWLHGPIGTGKSTIIQILRTYDFLSKLDDVGWFSTGGFSIVSASLAANMYVSRGLDGLNKMTYNDAKPVTVAFDEVGREPYPVKHFGTEMNVMQFIFQTRYELRYKCLTHVTTNMKPEKIADVYGDYIADRVNEMFNVIKIDGESRR